MLHRFFKCSSLAATRHISFKYEIVGKQVNIWPPAFPPHKELYMSSVKALKWNQNKIIFHPGWQVTTCNSLPFLSFPFLVFLCSSSCWKKDVMQHIFGRRSIRLLCQVLSTASFSMFQGKHAKYFNSAVHHITQLLNCLEWLVLL